MSELLNAKPFPISKIIERLNSSIDRRDLDSVSSTAQYASIKALKDFRPKTAYVLLSNERWNGEPVKAGRQGMIVNFGVVIAVSNYRDIRKGAETAEELDPLVDMVRGNLIGWTPPDISGARSIQLLEGNVLDYDENTLLWMDVYQTQHFIGVGRG